MLLSMGSQRVGNDLMTEQQKKASLPIPSLWVIPVHQPEASYILHRTWTGDSFLKWYYTCFNAILPNHPPSLSHRVQKIVLYICVSFAVSHTVLSLLILKKINLSEEKFAVRMLREILFKVIARKQWDYHWLWKAKNSLSTLMYNI